MYRSAISLFVEPVNSSINPCGFTQRFKSLVVLRCEDFRWHRKGCLKAVVYRKQHPNNATIVLPEPTSP